MPWFYFYLRTPAGMEQDEIGVELTGVEAAFLEACNTVPALSSELTCPGENPLRYAFEITDAAVTLLMELPFSEVLNRGRRPIPVHLATNFRKAAATMERTARLISDIRRNEQRCT